MAGKLASRLLCILLVLTLVVDICYSTLDEHTEDYFQTTLSPKAPRAFLGFVAALRAESLEDDNESGLQEAVFLAELPSVINLEPDGLYSLGNKARTEHIPTPDRTIRFCTLLV